MTLTKRVLKMHTNSNDIKEDDLILANCDLVLANDITAPVSINELENNNLNSVFDNEKIALVMDHFTPNKDIKAAMQCQKVRNFANKYNIKNFFDVGEMGIEHVLLPEKGLVLNDMLVVGADSHTCTYGAIGAFSTGMGSTDIAGAMHSSKVWLKVPRAYKFNLTGKLNESVSGKDLILHIIGKIKVDGALYKSMEFGGHGIKSLTMDDRFTICNMGIEAGAKNAIFEIDDIAKEYLQNVIMENKITGYNEIETTKLGDDSEYEKVFNIDLSEIKNTVAFPHLPENTKTFDKIEEDIRIDQVVIGSCTNGRLSDLEIAANVLKGNRVSKNVRTIIIPGTQKVYLDAMEKGYLKTFIESGCIVSTPTCGPCLGGHMGILAENEKCVSTTNRNFIGRMGHTSSEIYLASPYVAAKCAIYGKLKIKE